MILVKIMEECDEVSQRCAKALRFTLEEVQPGQEFDNACRIVEELKDLFAAVYYYGREGVLPIVDPTPDEIESRIQRIKKYMEYSKSVGAMVEKIDLKREIIKAIEATKGYRTDVEYIPGMSVEEYLKERGL